MSSAYLRLLIFLPAILISAYASSSPAFLMMYCSCKLNKQGDNIQPWRTPFPIWNQSVVSCPVVLNIKLWQNDRTTSLKHLKTAYKKRLKVEDPLCSLKPLKGQIARGGNYGGGTLLKRTPHPHTCPVCRSPSHVRLWWRSMQRLPWGATQIVQECSW